jgi:hypothetical protein
LLDQQYSSPRAYPRLPLTTPVEIRYATHTILGHTENISLGGLLAMCDKRVPKTATELTLLFNLPNGTSIHAGGIVRHVHGTKVGVEFKSLPAQGKEALDAFTKRLEGFTRRGERKQQRLHVTLRDVRLEDQEQLAETVLLSRNGGLLICRAPFSVGDRLELYWPEKKKGIEISVVFQRPCGPGGLTELGFKFLDGKNFWGLEFQTH